MQRRVRIPRLTSLMRAGPPTRANVWFVSPLRGLPEIKCNGYGLPRAYAMGYLLISPLRGWLEMSLNSFRDPGLTRLRQACGAAGALGYLFISPLRGLEFSFLCARCEFDGFIPVARVEEDRHSFGAPRSGRCLSYSKPGNCGVAKRSDLCCVHANRHSTA